MRLRSVHFIAFGPFDEVALDFSTPSPGFHIVYGPNEAGKSSALRGLTCFLYGMPLRLDDDFRHPYAKLRIGGELEGADGNRRAFVRRKARDGALRDGEDMEPLPDSAMEPFLAGADREVFAAVFGIGHEELVRGGEALVSGQGKIGEVLFAAGSGLSDLREVQKRFHEEINTLFLPRGKTPRINQRIGRHGELRRRLKAAQLGEAEWERHRSAMEAAQQERDQLAERLAALERERHRLERIRATLPLIGERNAAAQKLAELAAATLLAPDFSERRRRLVEEERVAEAESSHLEMRAEGLRQSLGKLEAKGRYLPHKAAIEALHLELGSFLKAQQDRPRLDVRRQTLKAEARKHLNAMGLPEAPGPERPSRIETGRVQELAREAQRLGDRAEAITVEDAKLRQRQNWLSEALEKHPPPPDTTEWRRRVETVRQKGDVEAQLAKDAAAANALRSQLLARLERQTLWSGPLEKLTALPLPPAETIDRFENDFSVLEAERKRRDEEHRRVSRRLAEITGSLESLVDNGEGIGETDLVAARELRDEGWRRVRKAWESGERPDVPADGYGSGRFPPDIGLADAYERSVRDADDLVDRIRREADRIARIEGLRVDAAGQRARLAELQAALEAVEVRTEALQVEWKALWSTLAVIPRSPREMRPWRQEMAHIAERVFELNARQIDLESAAAIVQDCRRDLMGFLADQPSPLPSKTATLEELIAHSLERFQTHDQAAAERQRLMNELQSVDRALESSRGETLAIEAARRAWQSEWDRAALPLGLSPETSPAQALQTVDETAALFARLDEIESLDRRVDAIDRDAAAFRDRAAALFKSLDPGLLEHPPELAVAKCREQLEKERESLARRRELETQLSEIDTQLDQTRLRQDELQALKQALCLEAGGADFDALPDLERQSAEKREWGETLAREDQRIRELGAGRSVVELVQEAGAVDPDGIVPELERLESAVSEIQNRMTEVHQVIGRERSELSRMDGNDRAAQLAEEEQSLLAALETDVEDYARLRLSLKILNLAVEAYRERSQDPLVLRSGALFERLTGGAFSSLRTDLDGNGSWVIYGVRSGSGELVPPRGMSDGTADQLYLAVRLAIIESHLAAGRILPFVADDILIHFDDERAGAALAVLGDLAAATQVIFFTHHRHLVDLAHRNVPASRLRVHRLERSH